MVNEATRRYDPWGRSISFAVRRWIVLLIALGLLGAAAGYAAGRVGRPSAEAMVRVQSANSELNPALELESVQVYQAAAEKAGVTAGDLRSRSSIAEVLDSQLVSITVTAPTAAQAVKEANGLAEAGIDIGQARLQADLKSITSQTRDLIRSQELSNPAAERARVAKLGDALAESQNALVVGPRQMTLFQEAVPSHGLPPAPLLGALGLVGGALLGLAIALLLGARRGTVHSARDLHQLYPEAAVIENADLDSMLNIESGSASTVFVAGVKQTPDELRSVTDAVRDRLIATGRDVRVLQNGSPIKKESPNGHINLAPTTLNDTVIRRIARDGDSLLIVAVEPRRTRLEWLDAFAPALGDRTHLLVNQRTPQWH